MGEPATVIVEVQGWANGKGCSRGVKIRLLRQNGHVESNGTNALCRTFKDQPPPSPPPHHLNPPSDSAAPKQPMRPDNSSISPPPPPPSSDPSEPAKPPASPPIDDSSEGAQRRRGRRPKTWARRLRQDEASELPIIAHQGAVQTAEDQDLVVSAGVAGNSSRSCSIPDATGACEVYQLDYVAMHWGSFVLVVLVDGEQAPESPFRPFVFPPPTYPWFNSSSLQVHFPNCSCPCELAFSFAVCMLRKECSGDGAHTWWSMTPTCVLDDADMRHECRRQPTTGNTAISSASVLWLKTSFLTAYRRVPRKCRAGSHGCLMLQGTGM